MLGSEGRGRTGALLLAWCCSLQGWGLEGLLSPSWAALSLLQGHRVPCLQWGVTLLAPRGDPGLWEQNSVCAHRSLGAGYIQTLPRMAPACAHPKL